MFSVAVPRGRGYLFLLMPPKVATLPRANVAVPRDTERLFY